MPLSRQTIWRPTNVAGVTGVTRSGAWGALGSGVGNLTIAMTANGERTFGPGVIGSTSAISFSSNGFLTPPASWAVDTPPGTIVLPAQTITITAAVTSTASNGLALGQGNCTLRAALWALDPVSSAAPTLIASNSGSATTTRGLGAANPTVTLSIPRTTFPTGWVLYVQIGGLLTAPQPVVGSNTETYTVNYTQTSMQIPTPPRIEFARQGSNAVAASAPAGVRSVAFRRSQGLVVASPGAAASRVIAYGRAASQGHAQAVEAIRQAHFPRVGSVVVPSPDPSGIRVVTFRRVVSQVQQAAPVAARRVIQVRRTSQAVTEVTPEAVRAITYGRVARQALQPTDDPVIDPTRKIHAIVRDGDGQLHGAGALVVLFRSDTNFPVQTGVTDASSEVVFLRNSFDPNEYFFAAWDEDGAPLPQQAVTERTLTPEPV